MEEYSPEWILAQLEKLSYLYPEDFPKTPDFSEEKRNGFLLRALLVLFCDDPILFYAIGVRGVPRYASVSHLQFVAISQRIRRFVLFGLSVHAVGDVFRIVASKSGSSAPLVCTGMATGDVVCLFRMINVTLRTLSEQPEPLAYFAQMYAQVSGKHPYVPAEKFKRKKIQKRRVH